MGSSGDGADGDEPREGSDRDESGNPESDGLPSLWAAAGDPPEPPDERDEKATPERRKRRAKRILLLCLAFFVLLVVAAGAVLYGFSQKLANNVTRIPNVFPTERVVPTGLPTSPGYTRPSAPAPRPATPSTDDGAMTFLLVGSDTRLTDTTGAGSSVSLSPGEARSDVMMLVRLSGDRKSAVVVSIPRDSYVNVPGIGMTKINDAFSFGGPALAVQTVEQLTGIRIDHYAEIDFSGFKDMVDALGGVDVDVSQTTSSGGYTFHQGTNHLDGEAALAYVRQRYGLPRSDLDRVQRQQNVLRAIMRSTISKGILSHPVQLYNELDAVTKSVSVDDTLSNGDLRSLALSLRHLRASSVTFMTVPIAGFADEDGKDVVLLDGLKGPALWRAVQNGTVAQYLKDYGGDTLPTAPR